MKALRWLPLLGGLLVGSCGSSAFPEPSVADASRGSARFPDLTLAELTDGRRLYVSRCGSCHVLKRPVELPPEQWGGAVTAMREKNGVQLSDAEAQAIARYLFVAATPG